MTTPFLRDPTGRYVIGPARDSDASVLTGIGATSILYGRLGVRRGVYVDNETPDRAGVISALKFHRPGVIVVSLYPSEPYRRFSSHVGTRSRC